MMDAVEAFSWLLWLYWVLATGAAATALIPIPAIQAFRDAVTLSACRGKLWENRPAAKLGLLTNASVPQRWFAHFYALGALCNGALLAALALSLGVGGSGGGSGGMGGLEVLGGPKPVPLPGQRWGLAVAALLQLHLVRRWVETVWVMRYPERARMHAIAYLFGLSYYAVLSASLLPLGDLRRAAGAFAALLQVAHAALAGAATSGSGSGDGGSIGGISGSDGGISGGSVVGGALSVLSALWGHLAVAVRQAQPRQLAGAAVFLAGNVLQAHSHAILGGLQRVLARAGSKAEGREYVIPHGGAFALVSCPHYLGEVVVYLGLAMAAGGTQALVWVVLLWVVVNLVLAAGRTHAWYLAAFGDAYPRDRAALIPLVY